MKIKYLGTGAAEGFPAMFCNCTHCKNVKKLGESEFRTRSQVLIDEKISIDFPPEAYAHSLKHGVNLSNIKHLLVSHSHMDHFYAHDFILRGYKYAKEMREEVSNIFGNSEVLKVYNECTARELKKEVAPHICLNEIAPYQVFSIDGYKIITLPAHHSSEEEALLFYIEKNGKGYLHLYDTGEEFEKSLKFLAKNNAKVNLVSFDCTFVNATAIRTARHMGIENNMLVKNRLISLGICNENTKYVITHFSHNVNPTKSNLQSVEEKYGVTAAYDGMEVEI
ncbi:MAG: hypothetical protein J6B04_00450 [Clostridia bacterium]|nr:hypothetical protein [Clostridia bacterium]